MRETADCSSQFDLIDSNLTSLRRPNGESSVRAVKLDDIWKGGVVIESGCVDEFSTGNNGVGPGVEFDLLRVLVDGVGLVVREGR